MAKTPRLIPNELRLAVQELSSARASSVLNAYDAFVNLGVTPATALRNATRYARKLNKKRRAALRRTTGSSLSRVAARHEGRVARALNDAARAAQITISLPKLEASLVLGVIPWEVLEPALQKIRSELDG